MIKIGINDQNLFPELKKRNPKALEYVMDTYGKSVYWLVYRILKDVGRTEDVEECTSDVFVEIWNNTEKYDGEKGSFKTWVLIVAKYKALDYRRKIYREEKIELTGEITNDCYCDDVEDKVIANEKMRAAINLINGFEKVDRNIFYKRYFLYESIEEIAHQFGLTKGAVYKRLWRSREILKSSING